VADTSTESFSGAVIAVEHLADAAVVRSLTRRFGQKLGFAPKRAGEAALVASELATNIAKYAGVGEVTLCHDPIDGSLWIVARDRGAGPPPLHEFFADRVSRGRQQEPDDRVGGGLGSGGAAVRRLSSEVHVLARPGGGSEIVCRVAPS